MRQDYVRALSRDDLSQWLVHLTTGLTPERAPIGPLEVVRQILSSGVLRASKRAEVLRVAPSGATSFYDVPPAMYPKLIATNPNNRQPYGLIVAKSVLWSMGARPAIYADNPDDVKWPPDERFRLIRTDLSRSPQPVDWTHEREWRLNGDLNLRATLPVVWWWPFVNSKADALNLFHTFPTLVQVYTMQEAAVLGPPW